MNDVYRDVVAENGFMIWVSEAINKLLRRHKVPNLNFDRLSVLFVDACLQMSKVPGGSQVSL